MGSAGWIRAGQVMRLGEHGLAMGWAGHVLDCSWACHGFGWPGAGPPYMTITVGMQRPFICPRV
jgi:hypothetical protein